MRTSENKSDSIQLAAVRVPKELRKRLLVARERESTKIGIEQSASAIVRRALELGLAQMERVK